MLKTILRRLHWVFGISAGCILAVMGLSGAVYSYDQHILSLLNPDSVRVTGQSQPLLSPAQLYQRTQAYFPERQIKSVTVHQAKTRAARVNLNSRQANNPADEVIHVNPYSGEPLPKLRGQAFFAFVQRLHRSLALGDVAALWSNDPQTIKTWQHYGKQLTGASTLMLIVLLLSGIYLRWPRPGSLQRWLLIDVSLQGRNFLGNLHAVAGTWLLVFYLLFALTGLYWAYPGYQQGLFQMMRVDHPTPAIPSDTAFSGDAHAALTEGWQVFNQQVPGFSSATFALTNAQLEISFFDVDPAHERARNILRYNLQSRQVTELVMYQHRGLNEQIMSSLLPLHRGSFFGDGGVGLVWRAFTTLAALLMPLFVITGVMHYLKGRRQKLPLPRATPALVAIDKAHTPWLIVYASQTGFARQLAHRTAQSLQQARIATRVLPMDQLDLAQLTAARSVLMIVSTSGQGEPPDHARGFVKNHLQHPASLSRLRYAILALGDHQYADTFCAFGQQLDHWLQASEAKCWFERINLDNAATHTSRQGLARWQAALAALLNSQLAGIDIPSSFDRWQLTRREQLNAGSQGQPVYSLQLTASRATQWQAGDIAEIQPGNSTAHIRAFLAHYLPEGQLQLASTLEEALRYVDLSDPQALSLPQADTPQKLAKWLEQVPCLPTRQYSIASIPQQGFVQLVVRQQQGVQGYGLGSGWLTRHVAVNAMVQLRIRPNAGFHAPNDHRPVILIGNGTGIAGLMSILRQRELHGFRQNWLIFGERQQQYDCLFGQQLQDWLHTGHLAQLDLAFSRDQPEPVYVQHRLAAQQEQLIAWINQGASLYVCGSSNGMAPAVDQVLRQLLGNDQVQELLDAGRYCRDVY